MDKSLIMTHKTIEEVLKELDDIVENSIIENNYLGIFAYVYRRTTAQIKAEIEEGNFEDNERLQHFDIVFANLYIYAYKRYTENQVVSKSWEVAFKAKNERLTIIQHLMMGMNAHINLDLAIAASNVMKGKPIEDLENDFNKVNDILAALLNEMQAKIGKVSFLMILLDWIGKKTDEQIINFSIVQARNQSWKTAQELWALEGIQKQERIELVDQRVSKLSEIIKDSKSKILNFVLSFIRKFEEKNIETIIRNLREQGK